MRITFVLPGYARDPIGGVRVVYNYANGLAALDHDVNVVHVAMYRRRPRIRDGRPRGQAEQLLSGLRDLKRGAPREVTWQAIHPAVELRYAPVLSRRHVPDGDVVVATAWQTADGVAALAREKGRRCYLIQHHETWSGRARRVDETWRLPLRKIFIAPWLYQRARDMGLNDIHRVSGAIDTERFSLRRRIETRPPRVAMLHSQWAWKGSADGVAALVAVRARHPEVQAVLFGAGPRPSDLPSWIEYRHDPTQDVLVDDVYNGSSIYLCPSYAEGWHLPPAEAMGCGCAVVSTDIDGVRDYAHAGETALLSAPRDPLALAANIERLLRDDAERQRIAHDGHAAIQQFTWPRSTLELEAVLASHDRVAVPA